jgi:hypothetical protein
VVVVRRQVRAAGATPDVEQVHDLIERHAGTLLALLHREGSAQGRRKSRPPRRCRRRDHMEQTKFKVAYVITERNEKKYWNRIGVAFTNQDGSINVKLDALPTGGTLQIRDYEPREELEAGPVRPRVLRAAVGGRLAPDQTL